MTTRTPRTTELAVACMLLALVLRLVLPGLHTHTYGVAGDRAGGAATPGAPSHHAEPAAPDHCLACEFDEITPTAPTATPAPLRPTRLHALQPGPDAAVPFVDLHLTHPARAPPALPRPPRQTTV